MTWLLLGAASAATVLLGVAFYRLLERISPPDARAGVGGGERRFREVGCTCDRLGLPADGECLHDDPCPA